mgnify:CR=1 FL=1
MLFENPEPFPPYRIVTGSKSSILRRRRLEALEKGAPEEIPCQCRLEVPFGGKKIPMIDYASAGKTWRQDSRMAVWATEPGIPPF